MKRIRLWLTMTAMLLCSITAGAHDFVVDGIFYNIISDNAVEVTYRGISPTDYYREYHGDVTIPSTVIYNSKEYNVTSIRDDAFYGCSSLATITLPEGVTSIGGNAFIGCTSLYDINIPEGVTSIGGSAFHGCSRLTSINIPESVTSIGDEAFWGCYKLTDINIPEGVTSIGEEAFHGCSSLTAINIPEGVTSIGNAAFYGCSSLTAINIPENVTLIGSSAFWNCSSLTAINIPEGVTSIDDNAFRGCSSLTAINIPEGVTSIGDYAFYGCSSLTAINIPEGVMSIERHAFSGCSSLTAITVDENNTAYDSRNGCNAIIETSSNTLISGCSTTIVPEGVTSIESKAFLDCSSLTAINIPESVTSIGEYTFHGCSSLTSITIPESVTSIGTDAFEGCKNLKTVIAKPHIAPILGEEAFSTIASDAELIYPEGSNYLHWGVYFSNFTKNNSVVFSDEGEAYVYNENGYIPEEFKGIKKLIFKNGITDIQGFNDLYNLECVIVPVTAQTIVGFSNCPKLKYICLPEGVTTVSLYSHVECVIIPESVNEVVGADVQVFRSLDGSKYGQMWGDYVMIPEGAFDYQNYGFSYIYGPLSNNCVLHNGKLIVWGGVGSSTDIKGNSLEDVDSVIFVPDPDPASHYYSTVLAQLPNLKHVDVYKGGFNTYHGYGSTALEPFIWEVYTIEGTNALFTGDMSLIGGCAISVIPEGTKRLEDWAFANITNLQSIDIPNSVTSIGKSAFENCTELQSIDIPNSVTSIGDRIFANCTNLASIDIPNSVTVINSSMFSGCKNLTSIAIDNSNPIYDSRDNSNAIIETASNKLVLASNKTVIPPSVTSIGERAFIAFDEEYASKEITIPATVTSIEKDAFRGVMNVCFESETPAVIIGGDNVDLGLEGAIIVPDEAYDAYCNADVWRNFSDRIVPKQMSEKSIVVKAAEGQSKVLMAIGLNDVEKVVKLKVSGTINSYDIITLRDKMPLLNHLDLSEATVVASSKPYYQTYCTGNNSLPGYAFYDLRNLLSVKLPKGLEKLGEYSFLGCTHLLSVDASGIELLDLGAAAFGGCYNLQEFYPPSALTQIDGAFSSSTRLKELKLAKVIGSIKANSLAAIQSVQIDSVGGNIETSAFTNGFWTSVENIKIGTLAGNVETRAFESCPKLRHVEFKQGPITLGSEAFLFSDNLQTVILGEGLVEIAPEAFAAKKTEVDIFGSTHEINIPRNKLKTVLLPQGVKKIGKHAFKNCLGLKTMHIPNGVREISEEAFLWCTSLKEITLPEGLVTIGNSAFEMCAIDSLEFPTSLKTIGDYAFSGCAKITEVHFPDRLRSIGDRAFRDCDLKELHIPSSVEYIGQGAFSGCNSLNSVYTYTVEPTAITETTFSTFKTATLHIPATSFWNYYWDIGWSRFNQKNIKYFNEPYEYFYLNGDYYLNDGTGYIEGTPDVDLYAGAGLVVVNEVSESTMRRGKSRNVASVNQSLQPLGSVSLASDGNGNSASLIGDQNLHIDSLHIKIDVKGGKWYFLGFPFDIPFSKIAMQNGSDYAFCYYDGKARAKNGSGGWKNVNDSYLKATQGYIFQSAADDVLVLSIANLQFDGADKHCTLATFGSENLNDASWNLISNPYLSYYDMAALSYSAPVTVWDGKNYVAIRPGDDDYQFVPYEAFFVQKPEGTESVEFAASSQLTKTQADELNALQTNARRTRSIDAQRLLINLELAMGEVSDRTRVVFNEAQDLGYETACDAAKFENEGMPQLYTIDHNGVNYAINERPINDGVVLMGYTAPQAGNYVIKASRMDTEVVLYDAETDTRHALKDGDYAFYSDKGTFEERFSLGVPNKVGTAIDMVNLDEAIKVIDGTIVFRHDVSAKVYSTAGALVAIQNGVGALTLQAGVYVIEVGDKYIKVVIR